MGANKEILGTGHETKVFETTIAWGELGSGPPLVLLHGIQDSHRTWRRVAPLLARHFRVLTPDLPGHGFSGRPDGLYTLPWYAHTVAEWLQAIGVEKAHFCGHSYGGGVAQWMLLRHRSFVDRLALVAAGGLGRSVGMGMRFAALPLLGRLLTPVVRRHALPIVLKHATRIFGHMEPTEIDRAIRMSQIPGTQRAFQRTLEGVIGIFGQHQQTRQRVNEVTDLPPVALFWGTKDPIIPIRHGRATAKVSLEVDLTEYEGCGHFPHLELPQRFSRNLVAFLTAPNQPNAFLLPATPVVRMSKTMRPW